MSHTWNLANISLSFPINVNLEKNSESGCWEVEIRNFIGEKLVRRVILRPGVEVEASKNVKDQLELSGNVRTCYSIFKSNMLTRTVTRGRLPGCR